MNLYFRFRLAFSLACMVIAFLGVSSKSEAGFVPLRSLKKSPCTGVLDALQNARGVDADFLNLLGDLRLQQGSCLGCTLALFLNQKIPQGYLTAQNLFALLEEMGMQPGSEGSGRAIPGDGLSFDGGPIPRLTELYFASPFRFLEFFKGDGDRTAGRIFLKAFKIKGVTLHLHDPGSREKEGQEWTPEIQAKVFEKLEALTELNSVVLKGKESTVSGIISRQLEVDPAVRDALQRLASSSVLRQRLRRVGLADMNLDLPEALSFMQRYRKTSGLDFDDSILSTDILTALVSSEVRQLNLLGVRFSTVDGHERPAADSDLDIVRTIPQLSEFRFQQRSVSVEAVRRFLTGSQRFVKLDFRFYEGAEESVGLLPTYQPDLRILENVVWSPALRAAVSRMSKLRGIEIIRPYLEFERDRAALDAGVHQFAKDNSLWIR